MEGALSCRPQPGGDHLESRPRPGAPHRHPVYDFPSSSPRRGRLIELALLVQYSQLNLSADEEASNT
jgi:hypothetical protein